MKKTPLASAISSVFTASALCVTAPVLAQDQDEDILANQESVEEIIVTGSRIRKDVFTSSTPMDVIEVDEASIAGIANVGQLLQTNTVALGSPQVTSATSFQFVENGGLGASTISLRGLGANRTLVLLNGRRAGPAGIKGATSSFDLNVLPLAAIQRVEILKDGASSIYGSDAVAGVVNIITKKEDGATFDAFVSLPSESGGEESRLTASWGKTFSRGNFRVTADYNKREHLRRGDRDYFSCGNEFIFDLETGERADNVDPRTGEFHCDDLTWGHVWVYDYAADSNVPFNGGRATLTQFSYPGENLEQHIPGFGPATSVSSLRHPGNFFPVNYDRASDAVANDDHPFQQKQSLNPQQELFTLYAEGEYEFTEGLTGYAEVLLNRRNTDADNYRQYWSYIYSGDFDFGSLGTGVPGGGNPLSAAAGWTGEQWYSPTAITDFADTAVEVDYQRFVAGLRGDLTENWEWDLALQYSKSDGEYKEQITFADSIFDFNFFGGSCVGEVTSVRGAACVDVPWLDPNLLAGEVSPEVAAFLFGVDVGNTTYKQWSVDGFVTGEAFDLPAGTVGVAVGFHYREDEINDTPGENTRAGNVFFGDAAGITKGDDSTVALFAEVDVPILADKPGFESLTLNASARYTDVDSFGDDTTWKVGLNWQISDTFRLRANQGTSFRTPALFELFLADQSSSIPQNADPCVAYEAEFLAGNISPNVHANCAADPANLPGTFPGGSVTPSVFTTGGFGVLEAETSKSKTFGFVWQPEFANLSISIDYFDIEVKDEVDQVGGARIISLCYESDFGFAFGNTDPLCSLFDRSGVGQGIDNVRDSFINIASQRNRGYDFAARYSVDSGVGNLTFDLTAARQIEDFQALFEDTAEDFNGQVGDPQWVGESRITLERDKWSFFWGATYIGTSSSEDEFDQRNEFGQTFVTVRGVDYKAELGTNAVWYHAFSTQYDFDSGLIARFGVANAFDKRPPQLSLPQTGGEFSLAGNALIASQYDPLGRRFFLNLTMTFE